MGKHNKTNISGYNNKKYSIPEEYHISAWGMWGAFQFIIGLYHQIRVYMKTKNSLYYYEMYFNCKDCIEYCIQQYCL